MSLLSRVHSYMKTVATHFVLKTKYIKIYERIQLKNVKEHHIKQSFSYMIDIFSDCYIR